MTGYELFRKRIAPVLFLGVVGLIAYDAWKKEEHAGIKGTVVIETGEAAPRVRGIEAELIARGEPVISFRRDAPPDKRGTYKFDVRTPVPDGELRLELDLGDARKRLTRTLHIDHDATVRVDISPDLAR